MSGLFEHGYPYTDAHELNLSWVILKVKELAEAWAQVQQDWTDEQAAFANLQSWIENYFNNLNVQTEINVKIDAMVAAGTMSELIAPYVASGLPAEVAAQIGDVVAAQIGPVVAAQISAVVADQLPAVAAAAAATEVSTWLAAHVNPDTGYVIDDTFTVQGAAADAKAVGDEFTAIKSALSQLRTIQIGKNLFDFSKVVQGMLSSDGSINNTGAYASYSTSDFIEIDANSSYVFACEKKATAGETEAARKVYALYGANMDMIADSYVNDNTNAIVEISSGSAKYIRISALTDRMNPDYAQGTACIILQKGTELNGWEAYKETVILTMLKQTTGQSITDIMSQKAVTDALNSVSPSEYIVQTVGNNEDRVMSQKAVTDAIDGIATVTPSINIFDISTAEQGGLSSNGTLITTSPWDVYQTSALIPLELGEDYIMSVWNDKTTQITNVRMVSMFYDENMDYVSATYQNINDVDYLAFSNVQYPYIRICARVARNDYSTDFYGYMQLEKGSTIHNYDDYGNNYVFNLEISESNMPFHDNLYGKKWYACGDSFTHGDFTGTTGYTFTDEPYRGKNKVYPYFIGRRCGMEIVDLAVGGMTMAKVEGSTNNFSESVYQSIGADADYVTLKFGINDNSQGVPIGNITDETNTTFYGAWNVVLTWIITNRPTAKIGIIVSNGAQQAYAEATIAIAKKYGLPYLNEYNGEQVPVLIRSGRTDVAQSILNIRNETFRVSPTNTHPNVACHEYESAFVETWLRTL